MSRSQPPKAHYKLMTKEEYADAQRHYKMPLPAFRDMLGISWRQEMRYRLGQTVIPDPIAKLLRTIVRHDIDPDEVG